MASHTDVIVVGAGISGIDAAYHLKNHAPGCGRQHRDRQRKDRATALMEVLVLGLQSLPDESSNIPTLSAVEVLHAPQSV